MKEFVFDAKPMKLSAYLGKVCPEISYTYLRTLLRMREVKINGKRVNEDIKLFPGDSIQIYAQEGKLFRFVPIVLYEDKDFRFFDKPRGISSEDYAKKVSEYYNEKCYLCHRLDTNTQGILMTARNPQAESGMAEAIKKGAVEKYYLAILCGIVEKPLKLQHYLLKDAEAGVVHVSEILQKGAGKIVTLVEPLETREDVTKAEIRILTGKTHQIRAHLAFVGHPVLGDPKYGDYDYNRRYRAKKQYLTAYRICFHSVNGVSMGALDGMEIQAKPDFI